MYHRPPMYIHIGYTLSPKKEVGVGEEESSGIGEVEVVVREMYTGASAHTLLFSVILIRLTRKFIVYSKLYILNYINKL